MLIYSIFVLDQTVTLRKGCLYLFQLAKIRIQSWICVMINRSQKTNLKLSLSISVSLPVPQNIDPIIAMYHQGVFLLILQNQQGIITCQQKKTFMVAIAKSPISIFLNLHNTSPFV